MIFAPSPPYLPYSIVRKVRVRLLIMPSGAELSEPDSSAEYVIGSSDIISMTVNESMDICAKSLKPRSMVADIINTSGLSVINDLTGREIRARVVIGEESITVGSFYIDKIVFIDRGLSARIIASDVVTRMARFMTVIYVREPTRLIDVISSGMGATASADFSVDSTASDAYVFPEMFSEIDSARSCILKLAQAARSAAVWCDRHMKVRIRCIAKNDYVVCDIPQDTIIKRKSEILNSRTDIVRVYGKNSLGEMNHVVGAYTKGFIMASLHNDFMYQTELEAIAQNRLEEENFRHCITLITRCDPAIEVGDLVELKTCLDPRAEKFLVVGQKIEFGKEGLVCEMQLAGKGRAG